jgi:DNA polymerase-3 subunit beta
MQFKVGKADLLTELNLLQGVVERKNTIPILTNVLVEAGDKISLVATDLDVSLETECAADVTRPGSSVLQAKKLFDIVRNLPDSDIEFASDENEWVRITCGGSRFRIVGHAKEHFPSIPKPPKTGFFLQSAAVATLISRTIFAITQEESRFALNGALFTLSNNSMQMVTTDGHRLAVASYPVEEQIDDVRVIIPKKSLTELLRILVSSEDTLEFSRDDNHLFFRMGKRQLASRTLAGQFPNHDLVMPKNNDRKLTLNVQRITQSLRRAALMADERSHAVKFAFEDGLMNITSQTADLGEAQETVPVEFVDGNMVIRFNALYMLDFLGVLDSEEMTFEFKDEKTPVLLKPHEATAASYSYVIMPMRL